MVASYQAIMRIADINTIKRVMPTAFLLDILAMDLIDHGSLAIDQASAAKLKQHLHELTRIRIKVTLMASDDLILEAVRARIVDIVEGRGAYE